jgi:uncharacterized repeat protein (TIGR01451 family)
MSLSAGSAGGNRGTARARVAALAVALTVLLGSAAASQALHSSPDTAGHTTLEQVLAGADPDSGYATLSVQEVSDSYLVRDASSEGISTLPAAQTGREQRRRSLAYFGQLTDFQLADEESPARVEFVDEGPSSAWRPQEAFQPFVIDWSIRQMNLFAPASPVPQGSGGGAPMDFALVTGDQADSQQRNETVWTRQLLEGGSNVNFNSGSTDPADYSPLLHPSCAPYQPTPDHLAEALRYTGVQDYDDYDEGPSPYFYDPDDPRGYWLGAGWPTYPGLMDRAQEGFQVAGLDVPSYVTNGNHDTLVQGNEDANEEYENIAMGCLKALGSTQSATTAPDPDFPDGLDPSVLLAPPSSFMHVPPDPARRYVSKPQVKAVYGANDVDDDHGFEFVDPAEDAASNGSASYYAWDPPETPGVRFISLDTVSEGGVVEESSNGNIDDPQFQWLKGELDAASAADKLIVIFGHHPVRSLNADVTDEAAGPCLGPQHDHGDTPEHDRNPGCDLDTRDSNPIHLGKDAFEGDPRESFVELLDNYPHVLAYVAGHTHDNNIDVFPRTGGGVWWGIETSATADWPQQHRLIELMDNRDGTLSIFGTLLDHASSSGTPPSGSAASGFSGEVLAAIGRTFAYNDPQAGDGTGEGERRDQNVELLVDDPRSADLSVSKSDSPDPAHVGQQLTYTITVTNNGASTATGVTLRDNLPKATGFGSASSTQGSCTRSKQTVTCNLGDLADDASATVTIVVKPTKKGTITNVASAAVSAPTDPVSTNNSDSEETKVLP